MPISTSSASACVCRPNRVACISQRFRNASRASTAGSRFQPAAKNGTISRRRLPSSPSLRRNDGNVAGGLLNRFRCKAGRVNELLHAMPRAILSAWLVLGLPAMAYGHAVVIETVPADGALLEAAPEQVVIRFNEPVTPVSGQVVNAAGVAITPADPLSVHGD